MRMRGVKDTQDGKRWCKQCSAYIDIALFKPQMEGKKFHLCRIHAKMKWGSVVTRAKERAASFCRKSLGGLRSEMKFEEVQCVFQMLKKEDRDRARIVPKDPCTPLSVHNFALVSKRAKRKLAMLYKACAQKDVSTHYRALLAELQMQGC